MALPVIAWRTILRNAGALVTASSTASGDYAAGNVRDWRSFTLWKCDAASLGAASYIDIDLGASGAADADSLVLVNHNMVAAGGQIKIYAGAGWPPAGVAQALYTPSSDAVEFKAFGAPGASRYWRVEFNRSGLGYPFLAAPYAGVVMLGLKMTLPEYADATLDPFMADLEAVGPRTTGGHAAGVLLRGIARRGTLNFGGGVGLTRTFLTSDFNAFLTGRYLRHEPFCFQLDSADSEFAPARWIKRPIGSSTPRTPLGGTYARFIAPLPFEEAMMEAAP